MPFRDLNDFSSTHKSEPKTPSQWSGSESCNGPEAKYCKVHKVSKHTTGDERW